MNEFKMHGQIREILADVFSSFIPSSYLLRLISDFNAEVVARVQKNSRLYGCEPEEDFMLFYVILRKVL